MTYTAAQVEAAVEDYDGGWGEIKYEDKGTLWVEGVGVAFETIDEYGGEGKGDDAWVVIKIGDQLFRKEGYYASHYGYEWDGDVEEVRPVEKTITVYETI
jgi:hypothetical protein